MGDYCLLNTAEIYNGFGYYGDVDGYAQTQLEVSSDGLNWRKVSTKALDEYQDVDSTMKKLVFDAGGVECRYFRFKAIGDCERWAKVYEVKYDASYTDYVNRLALDTNMTIYGDYTANKAMDNDISTYAWIYNSLAAGGEYGSYKEDYIQVDLGTLVPLYDASIYFGKNTMDAEYIIDGYYSVRLQTSIDGKTWKDAGDSVSVDDYTIVGDCYVATLKGDGSLARYIRFVADQDYRSWAKVYEIKYNQTLSSTQTAGSVSTNMVEYGSFKISNTIDGDMSSKFYSGAATKVGDYIQVDLGKVGALFDASIYFGGAPSDPALGATEVIDGFASMDIQVSTDGSNWTTVASMTNSEYSYVENTYLASIS